MKKCAICKNERELTHKMTTSKICQECNNRDYIKSYEVGEILNIHATCIVRYKTLEQYDRVPKIDAILGKKRPLWKRATVNEFLKSKPYISESKVRLLASKGINRKVIAQLLEINIFDINKFCFENRIQIKKRSSKARGETRGVDYKTDIYNRANRLFNKCMAT